MGPEAVAFVVLQLVGLQAVEMGLNPAAGPLVLLLADLLALDMGVAVALVLLLLAAL